MLSHTLAGSMCGNGQSARSGVQQAGKAGSRFMAGIVRGLVRLCNCSEYVQGTQLTVWLGCMGHTSFETRIGLGERDEIAGG